MTRWLNWSPFLAVGIYTSGKSRACRDQPNLTPAWVDRQLRDGWRLLPITLGPQASCATRFPRYGNDPLIDATPGSNGRYTRARAQGQAEAVTAVEAAERLGIPRGSTLWYDLEGYRTDRPACRESALAFLSGWSAKLHALGWVSGVYSSAGSGIRHLDEARRSGRTDLVLPDQLWIARWSGTPGRINDSSTTYLADDGWARARVHQYRGGHDETWGGVTINIDSNWLDLGRGSVAAPERRCGGVRMDFRRFDTLRKGVARPGQVSALQCLLTERGTYRGPIDGTWDGATWKAADTWRRSRGILDGGPFTPTHWVAVWAQGGRPALKVGSSGPAVRRLQRALTAAGHRTGGSTGVFTAADADAVTRWQRSVRKPRTGVFATYHWAPLQRGRH
nr:glycoside hydrolase domain-containing protein [Nocardioides perillae]